MSYGIRDLIYDELSNVWDEYLIPPAVFESWLRERNNHASRFFSQLAQYKGAAIVRFTEPPLEKLHAEVGLADAHEIFAAPFWAEYADSYGGAKWAAIVDAYGSFMATFKNENTGMGADDITGAASKLAGAIRHLWEMPHNTGLLGEKLLRWIHKKASA